MAIPYIMVSAVLLLIRLVMGITFIASFVNKWRRVRSFSKDNGLPLLVGWIVVVAELAAGVGLITGVLGEFAALGVMLLMLITMAIHIFKWKSPYWAAKGGWEYDLFLFTLASVIALFGTGVFGLHLL